MPHNGFIPNETPVPNHLEHPEDEVLTGNLDVLNWFTASGDLSVKIDGAPSVGFGINPATGKFAVATKSFLNKKKIRIAHSHEEINALYDGEVAEILHGLFDWAPREYSVWIQADWIGFGGQSEYTPNTITYSFPEVIQEKIILSPHTMYWGTDNLNTCKSAPIDFDIQSTDDCLFVKPDAWIAHGQTRFADVEEVCNFARQMATTATFVTDKEAAKIKQQINACIRAGEEVNPEDFDCDTNLLRLWALVKSIKDDCLYMCRCDGPEAYIGQDRIVAEGFVMSNEFGSYKLVNREVFSKANFNHGRFQQAV